MKWVLAFMLFGAVAGAQTPDPTAPSMTTVVNGKTYYKGYKPHHEKGATYFSPLGAGDQPTSYNAVTANRATPVKGQDGQGSCGDCWAWARTSSLEAAAIYAGVQPITLNLSEEDTTDNATDEDGCDGGSMDFNYEINHGVTTTVLCPWEGGGRSCNSKPVVQGYKMAYIGDSNGPTDAELTAAIYQFGSVAVTIAAGGNFIPDSTDELADCSSRSIDHMVSLVGYRPSKSGGVEYLMKNSWGTTWGDFGGYAYLALGCDAVATGDQSAMVIYVNGPGPTPVVNLGLPIEVAGVAGESIPIQVQSQTGLSYAWSDGTTGAVDWVTPVGASGSYTLTATDVQGNKTSATVTVAIANAKKG